MTEKYSVPLEKVIRDNGFEVIYTPKDPADIYITCCDVNRPGLILAMDDKYFDPDRIQFLGLSEYGFLKNQFPADRRQSVERLMERKPSAVVITRNMECLKELARYAKKYAVPLLRTNDPTSYGMSSLITYLNAELAPRITRHGVLIEVSGEGVLLLGDSGVGKSETAVELIKRGHRLIADDAVEIRRVSKNNLVGSAPDNIRHFIEIRGIGIINAGKIFGTGAVKLTEKIDMVIQLEQWDSNKVYDRMGLDDEYVEILDVKVPTTIIPVKPGRNLAIIVEIAAMNNRQKKMGYNAAQELLVQLGMGDDLTPSEHIVPDPWKNAY